MGVEGAGARGRGGRGTVVEGVGVGKFWGRGLYQNLLYFTDFYVLSAIAGYQKYIIDVLK